MTDQSFVFGQFELFPDRRLLLRAGQELRLRGTAFALLVALVERAGAVVSRNELNASVWPRSVVEETNLRVHIAALRKALDDDVASQRLIVNVPGRGYSFVAPLKARPVPSAATPKTPLFPAARSLPHQLGRVIGRSALTGNIASKIVSHRLVTIVGPGGIGKTTVALEVAGSLAERFENQVVFVDLTSVTEDRMVPAALAATLWHFVNSGDPTAELVALLQNTKILVVLDNCEHVIGAVAMLAEALVEAPGVHVLATSREILRAAGEWVLRLGSLELPPMSELPITAIDAMLFPAVELFVDRASSRLGGYVLTDEDAPVVVEICRKMDGIALAIEFAAGRMDTMKLRGLADSLDDCLRVLTQGRRTALPRHQTLRATLDWSYSLLPESERVVLRRLAIFVGTFTIKAAEAVVVGDAIDPAQTTNDLINLVAKSLVAVDTGGPVARYRLLDTTRAYALEKLATGGEASTCANRHAEFYCGLLNLAQTEWTLRPADEWLSDYQKEIGNVTAALDWAFSDRGDTAIGVSLSAASASLMFDVGMLDASVATAKRALAVIEANAAPDPRNEMRLRTALGAAMVYTDGPVPIVDALWSRTAELAAETGDSDYEARASWGMWNARLYGGTPRIALGIAERFCHFVTQHGDKAKLLLGRRAIGISKHYLGDQACARQILETMIAEYTRDVHRWQTAGFRVDHGIVGRANLARVLWLQGFADQAANMLRVALNDAQAFGNAMTLQYVLIEAAIPLAFLAGEHDTADRFLERLLNLSARHGFFIWEVCGRCYEALQLIRAGDRRAGEQKIRSTLVTLGNSGFIAHQTFILGQLAEAFCDMDRILEGSSAVDEALAQCDANDDRWCMPELLRVKGRLAFAQGATEAAEENMRKAMYWAQRQGALTWELRAATCLADHRRRSGWNSGWRDILEPVYNQFTEGFETSDLKSAKSLLRLEMD